MKLRLGTRGSHLARTQSGHVAEELVRLGHEVELVTIRSEGDVTSGSLRESGGLGLFAATLRHALLDGEVDLVVHSLKDLPTAAVDGLVVAAVPERENAFDVLCGRDGLRLADLPEGARVGTGSPRRAAQLRHRRPDLQLVEIRGNVPTRLARVHGDALNEPDLDAVVLAGAGLARLERLDVVTDVLDLLPAPGQGALAIECRESDADLRAVLAELDDEDTRLCVAAERAVLSTLEAGCAAPVGAYAFVEGGEIDFRAAVFSADGEKEVEVSCREQLPLDGAVLGRAVAEKLLAHGAADITPLGASRPSQLDDFHGEQALWAPGTEPTLVGRRVLLPRADGTLAEAIRAAGAQVDAVPFTETEQLPFALPGTVDWVVLTSPTAVRVLLDADLDLYELADNIAAVGPGTAAVIEEAGYEVDLVPEGRSDAESLLAALPHEPASALLPSSALASSLLADGLTERGWDVEVLHTYTTVTRDEVPEVPGWSEYDAVVLTAGSVARAVVERLGVPDQHIAVIALGGPSARASEALGLTVDAIARTQDGAGVVAALNEALAEEA